MKYRADIDGLRAIAVFAVILYHAELPLFSGGFLGVDIFFVISGFLITTLLQSEIEEGSFSFINFWERRIRRLVPAALFCLVITVIACSFVLTPGHLTLFGESLFFNSLLSSNFYFWMKSGYFNAPADTYPLLHTWSLAIEEQFYLLLPPALYAINRFCPKKRDVISILFVAASFLASIILTPDYPESSFYLLHTRGWELGIGCLLALFLHKEQRRLSLALDHCVGIIGLSLIAYSIFGLDKDTAIPSYNALYPTLGAALLIFAKKGVVARILSSSFLVGFGRISYALYLWHWVFFSFMKHYLIRRPTPEHYLTAFILAAMIAVFSYYFVEEPVRRLTHYWNRKRVFILFIGATLFGLISGAVLYKTEGLPSRFSKEFYDYQRWMPIFESKDICKRKEGTICSALEPQEGKPTIFLWGDSHGSFSLKPYYLLALKHKLGFKYSVQQGCPPLIYGLHKECKKQNGEIFSYLKEEKPIVFFMSRLDVYYRYREEAERVSHGEIYLDSLRNPNKHRSKEVSLKVIRENLEEYQKSLERMVFVHQNPSFKVNPVETANKQQLRREYVGWSRPKRELLERTAPVREMVSELGLRAIDPYDVYCDEKKCDAFDEELKVLYYDDDHLNPYGSERLLPLLELVLTNLEVL